MRSLIFATTLVFVLSFAGPAAKAETLIFVTTLSGSAESPPNASPGVGSAIVSLDTVTNMMFVGIEFSGLIGPTTAAHIHSATAVPFTGTAGVATQVPSFIGFPLGVTAGTFSNTYDMTQLSSYNPAFVTANGGTALSALVALVGGMEQGRAYVNVHTSVFPGGEIRGFLVPVPEPTTILLLGSGLASLALKVRRRRRI